MHPVIIKTRDGLNLVSYLTLPRWPDPDGDGRPNEPLPMVLNVHGGPWARDDWGYDPEHQLLANRGYAVLRGQLPRLDRLRQGLHQRGATASGPARCTTT